MVEFAHFGKTVIKQSCIHKEIESILILVDACFHLVQNNLFPSLLSNNKNSNPDI